jgi:hypothetical protein
MRERRPRALEQPGDAAALALEDPGPELEILLDGELGKDVRALGDVPDAPPLDGMRRQAVDLLAVEQDPAAMGMEKPEDGPQQGRFPGAVGPDDAGDRAASDPQIDPAEDVDTLDVAGVDLVELEQRRQVNVPGRPRARARRWRRRRASPPR